MPVVSRERQDYHLKIWVRILAHYLRPSSDVFPGPRLIKMVHFKCLLVLSSPFLFYLSYDKAAGLHIFLCSKPSLVSLMAFFKRCKFVPFVMGACIKMYSGSSLLWGKCRKALETVEALKNTLSTATQEKINKMTSSSTDFFQEGVSIAMWIACQKCMKFQPCRFCAETSSVKAETSSVCKILEW